jgi:hypothetical protein
MLLAVPWQESHSGIAEIADRYSVAGFAIGRFKRDLAGIVEQGVEAGAANDSDIRNVLGLDRSSLFLR